MQFATLEFDLIALNSLHFAPFTGSSFRGGFGSILRKLTCVTNMDDCTGCPVNKDCPFTELFNVQPPENDSYFKAENQVPRPFTIDCPENGSYSHGEHIKFRISVFGRAVKYIPFIVISFRQLGVVGVGMGRGKFKLRSVRSIDMTFNKLPMQIYDGQSDSVHPESILLSDFDDILNLPRMDSLQRLRIEFSSPTYLQKRGSAPFEPPMFSTIVRAILRRYSDLAALYGTGRPDLNYSEIVKMAEQIQIESSSLKSFRQTGYSQRKGSRTPVNGIIGGVIYSGVIDEFMPLLKLGQILHVGKQVTFGMGKYDIEVLPALSSLAVV